MAINFMPTVATGDVWTAAQHNTYLRDNILALFPYTAQGDIAYASSPTTLARLPKPTTKSVLQNDENGDVHWIDVEDIQSKFPSGSIIMFGGLSAPSGWLLCNGAEISRITYAALFAVCGISYGPGDSLNTFNLPDLRGRVPLGVGQSAGLTNRIIGEKAGEERNTLTINEMPSHKHPCTIPNFAGNDNTSDDGIARHVLGSTTETGAIGGGQSHNNMQPWLAVNYIIKT
jgi:microcystin-dependent protein